MYAAALGEATTTRRLAAYEKDKLTPFIPRVDLDNIVLHIGEMPAYMDAAQLLRLVDFRRGGGFTNGNDVYIKLKPGGYSEAEWLGLLGHELVHVGQFRRGMTWAIYLWSQKTTGYDPESTYEKPAYELERKIVAELSRIQPVLSLPIEERQRKINKKLSELGICPIAADGKLGPTTCAAAELVLLPIPECGAVAKRNWEFSVKKRPCAVMSSAQALRAQASPEQSPRRAAPWKWLVLGAVGVGAAAVAIRKVARTG